MSRLSLFLLGPPRLELADEPVQIGRRKALALLVYLAVTRRPHSRDALATLFWPTYNQSSARADLRRTLSVLTRTLGKEWVTADRETAGASPEAEFWLDVDQFRHLLAACTKHPHPSTEACAECVPTLEEAVGVYRDDFLAGFTLPDSPDFDEWQFFETEGLRDELGSVLGRLVRWHSSQGDFEPAIGYARRWLSLDALHEPVHRELMRLYAQAGQRAAALRQYRECARVLEEELGVRPEEETTRLYQAIREKRELPTVPAPAPAPMPKRKHNLPAQPTPFIGREGMLAEVKERLQDPDCRLLTLVGPGGSGKTRLAIATGAALLPTYEHGVFFISLAPLQSVESIEPTVASALGISLAGTDEPRQQLLRYLREKDLLLILDNFEHLIPPTRGDRGGEDVVTDILKTALNVKTLVTSRARLRVQGERLYPVAGMNHPDSASISAVSVEDVDQYSALKLFLSGARGMQPGFELTTANVTDVAQICYVVDGMPLGILLAAAWVEILSPGEIADEIGKSIDFLETDLTDLPARQRSMRAVFDHSWNLLTERQQEVCAGLSVFRGGFARTAARRVTGASLRELKGLLDRSLVQRATTGRYEMHELLRQYAADKLDASTATSEAARDRHCAYYIAALEQWEGDLKGRRQLAAFAEMDVEIENVGAAWDWAVERAQVERLDRAVEGLCRYYILRGRYQECEVACAAAAKRLEGISSSDAIRVLASVLSWQGASNQAQGRGEESRHLVRRSMALLDDPALADQDTRADRASILSGMARVAAEIEWDLEKSSRLNEQKLALYEELGDQWGTAQALQSLAWHAMFRDDYDGAKQRFEETIALFQALGDQYRVGKAYHGLGMVARGRAELEESELLLRKAIDILAEIETEGSLGISDARWHLGWTLILAGKFAKARQLAEGGLASCEHLGDTIAAEYHLQLGVAEMSQGQYERAAAQAEEGLKTFREGPVRWMTGECLWVLGSVELAEAESLLEARIAPRLPGAGEVRQTYARARRMLQEAVAAYRKADDCPSARALTSLAAAERGLGNLDQSWNHLQEALRQLSEAPGLQVCLDVLPAAALLLADAGKLDRAVELYALALRYPYVANSRWFEDVFGRHIDAVAATLPPEVAEAARERGRARDLQATVKELLMELEA